MKLRATLVWEYDLPSDLKERQATYQTADPAECAKVDNENDPRALFDACFGYFDPYDEGRVTSFTVEPVEEA